MYSEYTTRAMQDLRSLDNLQWYVIPLLGAVLYVWAVEIKKARVSKNWDPIIASLTFFGADIFCETWNCWVMVLTDYAPCWACPTTSAYRPLVGWNIEIILTFINAGFVYYYLLTVPPGTATKSKPYPKILGLTEPWFMALVMCAMHFSVECTLNAAGMLTWDYWWWSNKSLIGIILVNLFGYFHFYFSIILVLELKEARKKWMACLAIWLFSIGMNVFGLGIMGWKY